MKELEALLEKRWILKSENKELYYRIRDSIGEIRRFATDKMGCQVLENSLMVKLEKIPAIPEDFMGIEDFTSKEEYAFFCVLLMFLEDKDAEEQFILSQLTEYIAANLPGQSVDWTLYTSRRRLVKVLRYAVSQGVLKVTDGSDDVFMDAASGEVLYENTGASRYFMRNFSRDITGYTRPEDFGESDWFDMNEERGIARRHRVYKRLLFSPGMYRNAGAEEDFEYLKYYGRRLAEDLEQNFDCRVHIHKGSAFLLVGEDCRMGAEFPGSNAVSDILLLCCGKIREKVECGEWKTGNDDTIRVEKLEFERMLREVKEESGAGFTKNYREMPEGEFVREITEHLERWTFIRCEDREHMITIYPSAGKLAGHYPDDYTGGHTGEQQMAGK
ncbi:MAG: TIGR02678 family protein [Lachnospiraceae bacterium]|nr:TIGR02678 family protein [Lachnospiraceae bacterium]